MTAKASRSMMGRRVGAGASSRALEARLTHGEDTLDSVRNVLRGQRRPADVLDVAVALQRGCGALAHELSAPGGIAHSVSVRFVGLPNLDHLHDAGVVDACRNRYGCVLR